MKRKVSLKVGQRFRYIYKDRLCHVLGICATDEGRVITYRWWSIEKRRWRYEAEKMDLINRARLSVRGAMPLYGKPTDQLDLLEGSNGPK